MFWNYYNVSAHIASTKFDSFLVQIFEIPTPDIITELSYQTLHVLRTELTEYTLHFLIKAYALYHRF